MSFSTHKNPFRLPDYRRWFFASTLLSVSGGTALATSLLLVDMTGSPLTAGILTGTLTVVDVVATLLGGGLADRFSRRRLILALMRTSAVVNLVLVLTIALMVRGTITSPLVAVVLALILSEALLGATGPALDAALKRVISPEAYPRALSAAGARESTISLVGGPVTGLLYAAATWLPYLLRALCQGFFLLCLRRVTTDFGPGPNTGPSKRGYREAFGFLTGDPALRRFLLAAPLVNLMVATMSSWLVFSLRGAGHSAATVGLVVAGLAVGTLLGSTITPFFSDRVPAGWLAISGLSTMTLTFSAMALVPSSPTVLFAVGCLAMLPSPALNAGIFTYVFRQTPTALQGRVTAAFKTIAQAVYALGPVTAGLALSTTHTTGVLLGACTLAGAGVLVLLSSPAVRTLG